MNGWSQLQFSWTPSDRYDGTRRRRNPVCAPSPVDVARYEQQLDELAQLLGKSQFAWSLEGGMALARHLGEFRRRHSDVDIGVLSTDVRELEHALVSQNVRLFSRNAAFHLLEYAPFDLLEPVTAEQITSSSRVKRLTAIRVNESGRVVRTDNALLRFDIHVHHNAGKTVYLTKAKFPFPAELFERSIWSKTLSGRRIRVASIPFIYFFKMQGRRPRQRFDVDQILKSKLISESEITQLQAIFHGPKKMSFSLPANSGKFPIRTAA